MNICLISREYLPEVLLGGIGTYTRNVSRALSELGHNVHIITSTQGNDITYTDKGITVHLVNHRKVLPKEIWFLRYSHAVKRRFQDIQRQFDIVQACEFSAEAFWLALNGNARLITRLATPFYLVQKLMKRTKLAKRPLVDWMERFQTIHSEAVIASTQALTDEVCDAWKLDNRKVKIIPNAIDIQRVIKLANQASEALPDGLDGYILFFGRLEERKGVHVLAQALPKVFDKFPFIKAVFIGQDLGYRGQPMKDYVVRCAGKYRENLIFLDGCAQERLFPIIQNAKTVVLPSLWEAFGFVCIEAMALGRPVIATKGSGFSEIIENGVSGFLVEPGNKDALSALIIRCLSGSEDLDYISRNAEKRARDFEVSKIVEQLLQFYGSVINRKPIKSQHSSDIP